MLSRPRPFIVINASDLNTGMTFSFVQQQFDFLCSRISGYPVANAVMASSAVPGIFAPIAVRNFDLDCQERRESWVHKALETRDIYSREYQVALALERYSEPARMPIVRLGTGGSPTTSACAGR
jgi:NTE family protein